MTTVLVQVALGNLLVSALLAGTAYLVHRGGRYPGLAHLLWVLVLLKLVTPPLLWLPLAPAPAVAGIPAGLDVDAAASLVIDPHDGILPAWLGHGAPSLLALAWAAGSLAILLVSVLRIYRFERLLRTTSLPAPGSIQAEADEIAQRLGMRRSPSVSITMATVSPMTWWMGRRVRVVLPRSLVRELPPLQLRWVLAHELAHVKRRDHVVRWLEWAACVTFWWNPIAWWARRKLHEDEEASCDALVLARLEATPRSYAQALLTVVEHLSTRVLRAPAVATGIDGAASLERRFALMFRGDRAARVPRTIMAATVGLATLLLPMGLGQAAAPATTDENGRSARVDDLGPAPLGPRPPRDEYRTLSATLATTPRAVAPSATARTGGRRVTDVRRKLRVAERRIEKAERALARVGVAPGDAERRLRKARAAVRAVVWELEGTRPPRTIRRDLREARQDLRRLSRSWREARGSRSGPQPGDIRQRTRLHREGSGSRASRQGWR